MPHTLVGLIGAGLQRSLTPLMHEAEGRLLGLDYEYRLLDLDVLGSTAADLPELLATAEAEGYCAVNVTHPCKQAVVPLLDALDRRAARIGAVNLVLFRDGCRIGFNTDETGFRIAVERGLGSVAGQHVVQFGAGGAGSAIAHALVGLGVRRVDVVDGDVGRAEALVATIEPPTDSPVDVRVLAMTDASQVLATADGAVNATPLGMNDDPRQAFDPALLPRGAWVSDAVYFPLETPLVRSARAAGCRVVDGGWMAVGQAVASLRHITGLEPDLDRVRAAFTGFLAEGRTAGDRTGREAIG